MLKSIRREVLSCLKMSKITLLFLLTVMFVNFTYSQSISIDANDTRQYISMMGADMERSAGNLHNVATNRDSIIKWVVNLSPNPAIEGQVTINFGSNNTAKQLKFKF